MSTEITSPTPGTAPPAEPDPRSRSWIEIRSSVLRQNARELMEAAGPGVVLQPMVKANAYGLGLEGAVTALAPLGPAAWGVASVDEGFELQSVLRGFGEGSRPGADDPRPTLKETAPIQLFSPVPPHDLVRALEGGLVPSLSDPDELRDLPTHASGRFEVEVDTGMGRAGMLAAEVERWAPALLRELTAREGRLSWTGIFTHFHAADDEEVDQARRQVEDQLRRFHDVLRVLDPRVAQAGLPRLSRHAANSAGALRFPVLDPSMERIRPGIALYGGGVGGRDPAREVVAVRARVLRVADVPEGTPLGYASTYRSSRPERWATLGIGYGDGLPRALSNRGHALLHGRRVPMVGRISMDMTVVDVTELPPVRRGDVATLVGQDGTERIALAEVAEEARTIDYEILAGWTPRLPRLWLPDDHRVGAGSQVDFA